MEPTSDELLLTAYMDGELPPAERSRLEERLVREPVLRQQLTALEQTWNCLDLLEKDAPDADKVETTLKMAAVSVTKKTPKGMPPRRQRRYVRWFKIAAVFGVTFWLGLYFASDNPFFNRAVERLDMYLDVQDDGIELLRQLAERRVFLPPLPEGETAANPEEFTPLRNYGFLSSKIMSDTTDVGYNTAGGAARLYLYQKNLRKFHELSWAKKEQVRRLHWDIERAPRKKELVLTLQNYYHWRKSLQSYEKVELRRPLPVSDKVAAVIKLKEKLERQQPKNGTSGLSEIVGSSDSQRLAQRLAELPFPQQERLLGESPVQIIDELNRQR